MRTRSVPCRRSVHVVIVTLDELLIFLHVVVVDVLERHPDGRNQHNHHRGKLLAELVREGLLQLVLEDEREVGELVVEALAQLEKQFAEQIGQIVEENVAKPLAGLVFSVDVLEGVRKGKFLANKQGYSVTLAARERARSGRSGLTRVSELLGCGSFR